jgi:hypothetical protein
MISKIESQAKLVLRWIVNIAGNGAIIAILPTLLPPWAVAVLFLIFNVAMLTEAYVNPTYAVHLIQTGQMSVPTE